MAPATEIMNSFRPDYSETPNAKRMLAIGDIISEEFGLARFHVARRSQ